MGHIFTDIGIGLIGFGISMRMSPASSFRHAVRWYALGAIFICISDFLPPNTAHALVDGSFTTYYVWAWWNSGGGDGTKRRLKRWASKFRGARRTAPALGGA